MSMPLPDLPVPSAAGVTLASPAIEDLPGFNVAEYVARPRFHQRLTLPATDSHGKLKVTYAVGGSQELSSPTLLFIGGMFGGRYAAVLADYVARKMGVRIVSTDRPGMGGSTPVLVSQRISVWLETVPVLMQAIGAKHMSLAAHSCGAIYALNTLFAMPQILPPSRPMLALFTPWVPPVHSGVKIMSAAALLPSGLIGHLDSLVSFINTHVAEPVGMSSTAVSAVATSLANAASSLFTTQEERHKKQANKDREERDLTARLKEHCGCGTEKEAMALLKEVMRRVFEEDTSGGNEDGKLCLRKPEAGPYGECDNYEEFPERLDEKLREQFWTNGDHSTRVIVRAMWAVEDVMIGKGGERYFNMCFERFGEASESRCLVYRKETVPKTDHDSVILPHNLAVPRMLKEILGEESMEDWQAQD